MPSWLKQLAMAGLWGLVFGLAPEAGVLPSDPAILFTDCTSCTIVTIGITISSLHYLRRQERSASARFAQDLELRWVSELALLAEALEAWLCTPLPPRLAHWVPSSLQERAWSRKTKRRSCDRRSESASLTRCKPRSPSTWPGEPSQLENSRDHPFLELQL